MEPIDPKLPTSEAAEILDRVLVGEGSPEEVQWAAEYWDYTELGTVLGHAGHYAAGPGDDLSLERTAQLWGAILQRIEQSYGAISPSATPRTEVQRLGKQLLRRGIRPLHHKTFGMWGALAGAVLLTILLGKPYAARYAAGVGESTEYHTAAGQQSTVHLTNGVVAQLAPATTLTVHGDEFRVAGEVYFTVLPQASRPVTVRTRNAAVRVLGTAFSVRQYPTETGSLVAVQAGKVSVRLLRPPRGGVSDVGAVLAAGMIGQVADSVVTLTSKISVDEAIGWTNGRLAFHSASLHDVATELSRAYGVDVRINDTTLAARLMTMNVSVSTQTLAQVLDIICMVNDAQYRRVGDAYVLVPQEARFRIPQPRQFPQPETQYGR